MTAGCSPRACAGIRPGFDLGVGQSGTGSYHAKWSIETFSHAKSVFEKPLLPDTMQVLYPPFTAVKQKILRRIL